MFLRTRETGTNPVRQAGHGLQEAVTKSIAYPHIWTEHAVHRVPVGDAAQIATRFLPSLISRRPVKHSANVTAKGATACWPRSSARLTRNQPHHPQTAWSAGAERVKRLHRHSLCRVANDDPPPPTPPCPTTARRAPPLLHPHTPLSHRQTRDSSPPTFLFASNQTSAFPCV